MVERSIIGEGTYVYGKVYNSVIGCNITIGKDTIVRDSIIMNNTEIGDGCDITKAIIAEDVKIGNNVILGTGDEAPNETDPSIYTNGIVTVGEHTIVPDGISVGKNSVISGNLVKTDFENNALGSGKTLIKAGDEL